MKPILIRQAQSLSPQLRSGSNHFPGLKAGDFFCIPWKTNFGQRLPVSILSRDTLYFKTSMTDRLKFEVLKEAELPTVVKAFKFTKFRNKFVHEEFHEKFSYSCSREYGIHVEGYRREYKFIMSLANDAVEKLDKRPDLNDVTFITVEKQSNHYIWHGVDIE